MFNRLILACTGLWLAVFIAITPTAFGETDTTQIQLDELNANYSEILSSFVSEDLGGVNLVDYAGIKATPAAHADLLAYIAAYEDMALSTLSKDVQFAAWINIYNAVTLAHIVQRYPVKSIRSGYFVGPWKSVMVVVEGREISLHDIEHAVLRKDFADPRLHYAINCASIGCPNLMPRAWRAETLEVDLDAAARAYINHPRGVMRVKNGVRLSKIFKWFDEDFGPDRTALLAHLAQYADPELQAYLQTQPRIRGYDYDWALNNATK